MIAPACHGSTRQLLTLHAHAPTERQARRSSHSMELRLSTRGSPRMVFGKDLAASWESGGLLG